MKNKGGREAGKCSKVVPDRGDRCLFIFLWNRHLFCNIFPFPVCKAQLIGDWHENRWGAPNPIIFLIIRQYIGAPKPPAPIVMADRTQKKNYWLTVSGQHCLLAEGDFGAPISTSVNSSVCLTYFHTNRLLNELYKPETEIHCRKDDGFIKK